MGRFFCFIAVINIALKRSFDVKDSVIYLATWTNSMEKLEGSNEFAKQFWRSIYYECNKNT